MVRIDRAIALRRCPRWLPVSLPAAVAALALASCGAEHAETTAALPAAAEPAIAPPGALRPAGRSVRVGGAPEGIVADERTGLVVVALHARPQLVLLAARSGRLVRRVAVPAAPRHVQLVPGGGLVLVPAEPVDRLLELSLPWARLRSVKVGAHPHDAAAVGGRVFVGNEFGQSVSVVAATRVVGRIGGFVQPGGVAAAGSDLAVVDVRADTVTLIDAHRLRVEGRLGAGAGPTHAVADRRGRLYVVDTRGGAVLTFAARPTFRLVGGFALAGVPYGVTIDPARGRLWVTLTARDELVELATAGASLRLLAVYATGRQPNTVAVDSRTGRVFVADARPGTVQLIDPRR